MFFSPLIMLLMLAFVVALVFLFAFLQVGLIGLAFAKLGLPPQHLFGLMFGTLLGSFINIPLTQLKTNHLVSDRQVRFYGLPLKVAPVYKAQRTVLAINVGGALIPLFISLYLISKMTTWFPVVLTTVVVALVVNRLSRPVPGVGIAVPALFPPLITALTAYLIAPPEIRAPVAYIAGTLGTLIGADLMRLREIRAMGAPVASIGGAGTFDGVFLCGIIAVLLS